MSKPPNSDAEMVRAALWAYDPEEQVRREVMAHYPGADFAWIDKHGTQGFVFAHGDMVRVVFRGTEKNAFDWARNFKFLIKAEGPSAGWVHRGFYEEALYALSDVVRFVQEYRGWQVILGGHSKGAADALLMADKLDALNLAEVRNVHVFGAPRVGNREWALDYDRRLGDVTHSHVNNNDPVPKVPPWQFNYRHVGHLYFYDQRGGMHLDPSLASLDGMRWRGRRWRPITSRIQGMREHSIDRYLDLVWNHGAGGPA